MNFNTYKLSILIVVGIVIVSTIVYLESLKVDPVRLAEVSDLSGTVASTALVEDKSKKYSFAKEITTPDGFINTDEITIEELIGKKIILIDFWTYSCINCQRTTPFLNAWYEKYKDEGLVILGVHTPEFEFEKKYENVEAAVDRFAIKYPVILDNDFSTWHAYKNRYWPRKYIIDIDGYIVYDHIGEGGYEETEKVIQDLLKERQARLNESITISEDSIANTIVEEETTSESPEVYFGAWRNDLLANGDTRVEGVQTFSVPSKVIHNTLYFKGSWDIEYEFSTNVDSGSIIFPYTASKVHMVASGETPITGTIYIDGKIVTDIAGNDITNSGTVLFDDERLYNLVNDPSGPSTHVLEIRLDKPGLQAYTFTFG